MILQLSDWIDWFILFYSHFGGGLMVALIFFCGGAYLNLASVCPKIENACFFREKTRKSSPKIEPASGFAR